MKGTCQNLISEQKGPVGKMPCIGGADKKWNVPMNMSFEETRNSLVICFAEGSISDEEFLILYHEYESVNPLYPYWKFEPFCLDSLDSSECKSAKGNWFINKKCGYNYLFYLSFLLSSCVMVDYG